MTTPRSLVEYGIHIAVIVFKVAAGHIQRALEGFVAHPQSSFEDEILGRAVLLTGDLGGIGRALAPALLRRGCQS